MKGIAHNTLICSHSLARKNIWTKIKFKFGYFEKATKFGKKNLPLIEIMYLVTSKHSSRFFQICVAFSECLYFKFIRIELFHSKV